LYVICTKFPGKSITIPSVGKKPGSVTLLGSKTPVNYSYSGKSVRITPPSISPANSPCDYAWVFKIAGCL
ncbi:MAG: hypothetical protein LBE56_09920, partial [Tannerella sp.]|nr:hypothetical protein [Tannerella sp.]